MVHAGSGADAATAASAVASAGDLGSAREEALAGEMTSLLAELPALDAALEEALCSRGRRLGTLGRPEVAALRYGAWLLLGPEAMDAPLASRIAADLVDAYGEADARPLVQGCLSRVASRRPPPTGRAAEGGR